jgi:hypothetical protein
LIDLNVNKSLEAKMRSLSKRIGNVIDCGSFNDINLNSQHEVDFKKRQGSTRAIDDGNALGLSNAFSFPLN